jgi:hypothetical protein
LKQTAAGAHSLAGCCWPVLRRHRASDGCWRTARAAARHSRAAATAATGFEGPGPKPYLTGAAAPCWTAVRSMSDRLRLLWGRAAPCFALAFPRASQVFGAARVLFRFKSNQAQEGCGKVEKQMGIPRGGSQLPGGRVAQEGPTDLPPGCQPSRHGKNHPAPANCSPSLQLHELHSLVPATHSLIGATLSRLGLRFLHITRKQHSPSSLCHTAQAQHHKL